MGETRWEDNGDGKGGVVSGVEEGDVLGGSGAIKGVLELKGEGT